MVNLRISGIIWTILNPCFALKARIIFCCLDLILGIAWRCEIWPQVRIQDPNIFSNTNFRGFGSNEKGVAGPTIKTWVRIDTLFVVGLNPPDNSESLKTIR